MDGEETLTCVEREPQREPQCLMESLPGSATLCGYPGPVVLQMADGHVSAVLPACPGLEAEKGFVNLVKSLLVDGVIFLRKQRGFWSLAHLKIVERQMKLGIESPGIPEGVTSSGGEMCSKILWSAFSKGPGPGGTCFLSVVRQSIG